MRQEVPIVSPTLKEIILLLRERFNDTLPGSKAQNIMAPSFRNDYSYDRSEIQQSGVLALLYPKEEVPHFVLMKRSSKLRTHSGQISMPGGKYEPEDTSYFVTALRETYEELGISPDKIILLGKLTPLFIPISNFMVNPFVAYTKEQPNFIPSEEEVEKIIEVPLGLLLSEEILTEESWEKQGKHFNKPYFAIGDNMVWGATAMILNELRHMIL